MKSSFFLTWKHICPPTIVLQCDWVINSLFGRVNSWTLNPMLWVVRVNFSEVNGFGECQKRQREQNHGKNCVSSCPALEWHHHSVIVWGPLVLHNQLPQVSVFNPHASLGSTASIEHDITSSTVNHFTEHQVADSLKSTVPWIIEDKDKSCILNYYEILQSY